MKHLSQHAPWYVAGLAFECTECGNCCAGPEEGYIWVNDREITAIAQKLRMSEEQFIKQYTRRVGRRYSLREDPASKDCIFLVPRGTGKRGCRIYDVRPAQCRTWPFWWSNLVDPEAWLCAGVRCPGINRGPLFTQEEIESRAQRTRE